MQPHALTASVGEQNEDKYSAALNTIVTVDGIKATLIGVSKEYLFKHPDLKFDVHSDREHGQIFNEHTKYNGLTFTIFYYEKDGYRIELKGSLHVYSNDGMHNANDFTFGRLLWALSDLESRFGLSLGNCTLHNLETGLNNVLRAHLPEHILQSAIVYKYKEFKDFDILKSNGKQAKAGQYYIKFYDKGLQHSDYFWTFRFEKKMIRAEQFNKFGIKTLKDLRDPQKLFSLAEPLLKTWDDMLVFDKRIFNSKEFNAFSNKKKLEIRTKADSDYWVNLHKETKGSNKYGRKKRRFQKLANQLSPMKTDIAQAIETKLQALKELANKAPLTDWSKITKFPDPIENKVVRNDRGHSPAMKAARVKNAPQETECGGQEKESEKGNGRTEEIELKVVRNDSILKETNLTTPVNKCFEMNYDDLNEAFDLDALEDW